MALDLGIFLEGSQSTFKVKVSENDSQAQYLLDKLTSSDGSVTITEINDGSVEQINLTASGGGGGISSPLTTKGDLFTYDTADARLPIGTDGQILIADSTQSIGLKWGTVSSGSPDVFQLAASDETSDLTIGAGKITFRLPSAITLTDVRASVNTAPTGANLIVDINVNGTSIFTTDLLEIDAGEKTSTTAVTPPNITTTSLSDDDEISIDIDQIGSTVAGTGLKITLIGS